MIYLHILQVYALMIGFIITVVKVNDNNWVLSSPDANSMNKCKQTLASKEIVYLIYINPNLILNSKSIDLICVNIPLVLENNMNWEVNERNFRSNSNKNDSSFFVSIEK